MFRRILAALAVVLILPVTARGQDVDEITATTTEHLETLNAGDAAAHIAQHLPTATDFSAGGLLVQYESREEQIAELQAEFDAGLRTDFTIRDLNVKVYGDVAVVTGHVVGTATTPEGTTESVANQRTAVLVKRDGRWMEAHVHISPLTDQLPE
jgi:uncharacterized protein (TIGR02246 family)